jgi:alpha-2-macroglobulin-like protein
MRNTQDPSPGQRPEPDAPSGGFWLRWVVIAAVFVALLALPAARQASNWYDKSRAANDLSRARDKTAHDLAKLQADNKAATDAARSDLDTTTANEQTLTQQYRDAIANARKVLEDKDFTVRLTGPANIQPGAPNSWKVETLNRNGAPITPKKFEMVVRDSAGAELLKETQEKPTGAASTLNLPLAFWAKVKPGTELFLHVSALTDDDRRGTLEERIPLSRPVYVTHVATDKPLYKPGETVRFRSLTLDRSTLQPPAHDQHLRFRLRDPGDAVTPLDEGNGRLLSNAQPVMGPDRKPLRGIGVGEYSLPFEAPGGEYKLDLYEVEANTGRELLLETRKFIVNRYVPDVFEKKLEFDGKTYGAGDTVQARIEVSRTAGGPMKDAKALVVATVDGREFHKQAGATFTIVPADRGATKGILDVRFKLPTDIFEKAKGDTPPSATLALNIQDGSDAEPIVRPIPLVTKTLKVEFFPEGGEMIDGVTGRVYFMVKTPNSKPADIKGHITDGTNTICEAVTLTDAENPGVNRGHGIFAMKPEPGKKYFLKVTSPAGITEPSKDGFPLPAAKPDGVAITALDAVTEKVAAVRVRLQVGVGTKTLHVGAYARGRLVAHQKLDVTAGTPIDVALKGDDSAGGVTRVTAFEEQKGAAEGRAQLVPKAERLIFRKPDQQLILNANPDKSRYTPAGKVRLELSAFNEKETPVPAVLLVGVVNRSVITMADNKTDRLLPTHFLISGEVKHPAELEHADFLLTDHSKAGVALDLLLGTQGWRRFAEQNANPADPADKPDVDKMLVAHGQRTSAPFALYKLEEQRVSAEFQPKLEQAALARSAAQEAWNRRNVDMTVANQIREAQTAANGADQQYTTAAADLHAFETRPNRPQTWGLTVLAVALCALCFGGLGLTATRTTGSRRPFFLGTLAILAITGLSVAGVVRTWSTPEGEAAWAKTGRDAAGDEGRKLAAAPEAPAGRNDLAPRAKAARPMDGPAGGAGAMPVAEADFAPPRPVLAPAAPPAMQPMRPGAFPLAAKAAEPKADPKTAPAEMGDKGDKAKFDDALKVAAAKGKGAADRLRQKEQLGKVAAAGKPLADARPGRPNAPGAPPFGGPAGAGLPGPVPPGGFGPAGPGFLPAPVSVPFVVREYAHQRDPSLNEVRSDFTETVYWHPVLVLPDNGKASVEFQLSDDIARYQVLVAGHTLDGRIGAVTKTIEARQPFSVDPKLPLEISHTDVIDAPIRVTNDSDDPRKVSFALTPIGLKPDGPLPQFLDLGPNGKGRQIVRLKADKLSGEAGVGLTGSSGPDKDNIIRAITIVPDGFPGVGSISDTMEKRASGTVRLPKDVVAGSLKVRLEVYPTSMADLVKGLEGMLREPYGCFEQTSTSNYPNTMILDYMNQTNQTNPAAAKRAKELLDKGYAKLVSFECPDTPLKARQGFEWFGATDQQHEALTAYGLLQFKDMSRVHPVDPELIKRTQQYLLSRRDGLGGFKRNPRALDKFGGAPNHTTNAYIVWALVESDPEDAEKLDLTKEIQALKTEATNAESAGGKDAYFVALTANILLLRGDRQGAHALLDRLKDKHTKDGAVTGAVTSITRSGGRTLEIETTALALLGWLRANDPKYGTVVKDVTKWMTQQRGGYGAYGSTQSTILALKALTLFAKKAAHPSESGTIKVLVGGKEIAARPFSEKDVEVIGLDIPNAEAVFRPGESTEVEIVTDAKQSYPFALSYAFTSLTPVSAEKCAVQIATKLAKAEAAEGETVPLSVTFENKVDKGHGMSVAIIGIPAGMKVPTDMKQLTDLREKGRIAYFETRGRELVLYWRELAPKQKIELTVDLVCDVPGTYRGPASRGYLYYDADHKHWVEPLAVKIAPMANEKADDRAAAK